MAKSRIPRPSYEGRFVVHAPPELVERVTICALARTMSMSAFVREALIDKLEAEDHVGPSCAWPPTEREIAA